MSQPLINKSTKLTANVMSKVGSGRAKNVSVVVIKAGTHTVATAQLGGTYTAEQALTEYRRFGDKPGRFTLTPLHTLVKALGL